MTVTSDRPSITSPASGMDAMPFLHRDVTSVWAKLEDACAGIHQAFVKACNAEGVKALVLRSDPLVYPATILFECWIPVNSVGMTERVSIVVSVAIQPSYTYEIVYTIAVNNCGETRSYNQLHSVPQEVVHSLVRWLLRRERRPRLSSYMLRSFPLDFAKPVNRVESVRPDYLAYVNLLAWILGIATMYITWLVAIPLTIFLKRRVRTVRTAGKPKGEPRNLVGYDSWQAVLFGIGPQWSKVRDRFIHALSTAASTRGFNHHIERIWHRGLDGIDTREQIVLTLGRAIVFCQIFPYGDDLFVGWDGYLNRGQWQEQQVAAGIDRETGRLSVVNTVIPSTQPLTEYDIVDLSCLMEWAHSQLVRLVKQQLEEYKIDQEIDYKIVRGERRSIADAEKQREKDTRAETREKLAIRFSRVK